MNKKPTPETKPTISKEHKDHLWSTQKKINNTYLTLKNTDISKDILSKLTEINKYTDMSVEGNFTEKDYTKFTTWYENLKTEINPNLPDDKKL